MTSITDILSKSLLPFISATLATITFYVDDKFYNKQHDKLTYVKYFLSVFVSVFIAKMVFDLLTLSRSQTGSGNTINITPGSGFQNLKFNDGMPNF